MTYEEVRRKRTEIQNDPTVDDDLKCIILVRERRPTQTLTEPSGRAPFWADGVLLAGMPKEEEIVPMTDEDRAADDWDLFAYV